MPAPWNAPQPQPQPQVPPPGDIDLPWIDQFNQHLLLTVQALQRLHAAFDSKFTRPP